MSSSRPFATDRGASPFGVSNDFFGPQAGNIWGSGSEPQPAAATPQHSGFGFFPPASDGRAGLFGEGSSRMTPPPSNSGAFAAPSYTGTPFPFSQEAGAFGGGPARTHEFLTPGERAMEEPGIKG